MNEPSSPPKRSTGTKATDLSGVSVGYLQLDAFRVTGLFEIGPKGLIFT